MNCKLRIRFLIISFLINLSLYAGETDVLWQELPNEIHVRYKEATYNAHQSWVLLFADSLDRMSVERNNMACQYFASTIRGMHYFYKRDSLGFVESNKVSMELAQKLKLPNSYYNLFQNEVVFYVNLNHPRYALKCAQRLLADAKSSDNAYGLRSGYLAMGHIMWQKRDYVHGAQYYKRALDCLNKINDALMTDKAYAYGGLASCYFFDKKYELAIESCKKGLECDSNAVPLSCTLAVSYYYLNNIESFKKEYEHFQRFKTTSSTLYNFYAPGMDVLYKAVIGKFDEAVKRSNDISYTGIRYIYLIEVCKRMNDWKQAYMYKDKLSQYDDSIQNAMFGNELTDMTSEFDALYNLKQKDEVVMRQQSYLVISAIFIIAIFICGILFYSRYKVVKAKNRALLDNIEKNVEYNKTIMKLQREKYAKEDLQKREEQQGDLTETNGESRVEVIEDTDIAAEDNENKLIARFVFELKSRRLFADQNFNRDTLIADLHIKKRDFTKDFFDYTGCSYKEYITRLRLEYAATIITQHPELTMEAIAQECGINSYVTFHRNFIHHFGIAPSTFRNQKLAVGNVG